METAKCPGCHFGCAIERWQCARGERLCAQWAKTGELPERRWPASGGRAAGEARPARKPGNGGKADAGRAGDGPQGRACGDGPAEDGQLMHLLHIVGIALEDLERESGADAPERRIVECLARHEGAASAAIVRGRTGLPDVSAASDRGLIAPRADGRGLYELTESGRAAARAWSEERMSAEEAFLSALSRDERRQLRDLVAKLLEPGFEKRRAGAAGAEKPAG